MLGTEKHLLHPNNELQINAIITERHKLFRHALADFLKASYSGFVTTEVERPGGNFRHFLWMYE